MAAEDKLSEKERQQILATIAAAEKNTSGEIRLFVEDVCGENVLDRAAYIFDKLGMKNTKDRNGVLFYLAFESRQFAILGDAGIHAIVKGLTIGIEMSGKALKTHFPYQSNDKNELSDDIVFKV